MPKRQADQDKPNDVRKKKSKIIENHIKYISKPAFPSAMW